MRSARGENTVGETRNKAFPPAGQPARGDRSAGAYGTQPMAGMQPATGMRPAPGPQPSTGMQPATGKGIVGIAGIAVTAVVTAVMTAVVIFLVQGLIQSHAISEAEALAREKTEQLEQQQTDIDAAKEAVKTANEELKGKIDSFTKTIEEQKAEIESLRTRTEEQQTIIDEAKASGLIWDGE